MSVVETPETLQQDVQQRVSFIRGFRRLIPRSDPSANEKRSHSIRNSGLFSQLLAGRLGRLQAGQLTLVDSDGAREFGDVGSSGLAGTITVHDKSFYRRTVLGGALGAADAYIRGLWDSADLTSAMQVLARDAELLARVERGGSHALRPVRAGLNWLRRNTVQGSRRNIAAHYDLSNDFFALMLDPSMTYSSGVFPHEAASLEEASLEKYDRICRKLDLKPTDHLLEIGTGWGGFAEYAARNYGCRVTTTTISEQQHEYAARRFREAGIEHRVNLLKRDYRNLAGKFDKLVSIEMIEAVGEQYLSTYFRQCSNLLKPSGIMALQAITMPDHRFDRYRKSVDFIQRYIFPGGFLPSMGVISRHLGNETDFRFFHSEDFGLHYARTLACWRTRFWQNIEKIKQLGFDDEFIRTWHYYLCYCEAGFLERQIGVSQIVLTKPECRRASIL